MRRLRDEVRVSLAEILTGKCQGREQPFLGLIRYRLMKVAIQTNERNRIMLLGDTERTNELAVFGDEGGHTVS